MGNPFKAMIIGYFLTFFTAVAVLYIPDYDQQYMKWIVAVFVILLLLPAVLSFRYPGNKEKAYRLTVTYQLYVFAFFFTVPLLKVLTGNIVVQLLLVGLFIGIYFLARFDQRREVPILFPDTDRRSWLVIPFYAVPVLLTIFGVGGNYRSVRRFFESHEYAFAMAYLSTIFYILACWLLFLMSSIAYKAHVKEGFLEK